MRNRLSRIDRGSTTACVPLRPPHDNNVNNNKRRDGTAGGDGRSARTGVAGDRTGARPGRKPVRPADRGRSPDSLSDLLDPPSRIRYPRQSTDGSRVGTLKIPSISLEKPLTGPENRSPNADRRRARNTPKGTLTSTSIDDRCGNKTKRRSIVNAARKTNVIFWTRRTQIRIKSVLS